MSKDNNLHDFLVDIADAVREKKGTSDPINAQNLSEEIRSIEGGGATEVEMKDVNFYDYDGTRLYSYSWEEAMAMTELPPLPTQKGLICQEWNYTLEDIKAQNGACDVGATYITDDGKTRFYLTIDNERAKDIWLYLSGNIEVNWGDGTIESHNGSTLQLNHKYAEYGDYVVSIDVKSGTFELKGSDTSNVMGDILAPSSERYGSLRRVEIGHSVMGIDSFTFRNFPSLQRVVIPNGVTKDIGTSAFQYCPSLQSVVIPKGIKGFGNNAFYNCSSLQIVVIPNSVYYAGTNSLHLCSSLLRVVIPNGMTSIGNYTFDNCVYLQNVVISEDIKDIKPYVFQHCSSLQRVVIPNSVTSIGDCAFRYCSSLQRVVIPNSVTSIGNYALYDLRSCAYIDFSNHTSIPALSAGYSIGNLNARTKIIVPDVLYDEWIAATNWAGLVSYIVKDSEYIRPL